MARGLCAAFLLVSMVQARDSIEMVQTRVSGDNDDNIKMLVDEVVEASNERTRQGEAPDVVAKEAARAAADAVKEFGDLDGKASDAIVKQQIITSQEVIQRVMQESQAVDGDNNRAVQLKKENVEIKSGATLEQRVATLEKANAAQQAEIERLREGTRGKIATWVMGEDGENCHHSCYRAGLECVNQKMWEKNEEAELASINNLITVLGAQCYNFDDTRGHDLDVPAKSSETCFVTEGNRPENTVECEYPPRTSEVRMCWCSVIGKGQIGESSTFDDAGAVIPSVE